MPAEEAGGAAELEPLETLMKNDPGHINADYEPVYFSAPEAWAKALVRSGQFAEYARKTLGPDGAPRPSRLEQMLLARERPMLAAAALRAIALARDPAFKPERASAGRPLSSLDASSWQPRSRPSGRREDHTTRRYYGDHGI